jgi:hypothetical protein
MADRWVFVTYFLMTGILILVVSTFWLNSGGNFVVRSSFWSTFVVIRFMIWYRIPPCLVGLGLSMWNGQLVNRGWDSNCLRPLNDGREPRRETLFDEKAQTTHASLFLAAASSPTSSTRAAYNHDESLSTRPCVCCSLCTFISPFVVATGLMFYKHYFRRSTSTWSDCVLVWISFQLPSLFSSE